MPEELRQYIGRQMRNARKRLNLNQGEMAEKLAVSTNTYGAWERGDRLMPLDFFPTVCRAFDMPCHYFLGMDSPQDLSGDEHILLSLYRSIETLRVKQNALDAVRVQAETESAILRRRNGGAVDGGATPLL